MFVVLATCLVVAIAAGESTPCGSTPKECAVALRDAWSQRGTIGAAILANRPDLPENISDGWFVRDVLDNSASYRAGLRAGDLITNWNGTKIETYDEDLLASYLEGMTVGEEVVIEVRRSDSSHSYVITPIEPDEETFRYWITTRIYFEFGRDAAVAYLRSTEGPG